MEKMYLPISEDLDQFIGVTSSKDGLVFPLVSKNEKRFHVTAYVKETEDGHFIDIHIKDQDVGKYVSIRRFNLTKGHMEEFAKKCQAAAIELAPVISNYLIQVDNPRELHCIDCALNHMPLPTKYKQALGFWQMVNEANGEDVVICTQCNNPEHKTYYDLDQKVLLHKVRNDTYLIQDGSENMMDEIGVVIEKHFEEEIREFNSIIRDIIKSIEEVRSDKS